MPDLGFNSRTERGKWRAGGIVETPPLRVGVGPGSYDVSGKENLFAEGRPGYAPFLSTAERKFGHDDAVGVPGPGHYSSHDSCQNSPQGGRPSDVFRSGTRRFEDHHPRYETPGPGAYLAHEEFGVNEKGGENTKGDGDRIKWVRVPTAPSIPGRDQSYGYEEGEQGELVMQRPSDPGHSGKGDDRPGPVDYVPRIEYTRRSPTAVDFSRGEDRMVALTRARASTTPGPGHYNASRSIGASDEDVDLRRGVRRKRQHPTTPFHCPTKRDKVRRKEEKPLPGPGDYTIPGGLGARRDPSRRDLSFLSTSRRFDQPATGSQSRAPGPGSYVTMPSDFDRWSAPSRVRQRISQTAPIGFHSTTLRFTGNRVTDEDLSPASYHLRGMADEISRKCGAHKSFPSAFGSTSRRFPVDSGGQTGLPGPGSYDLEVGGVEDAEDKHKVGRTNCATAMGKRFPSALSCFASGTKRFIRSDAEGSTPAPGQYEVRPTTEKARGVLPMGKQSKNRFQAPKTYVSPELGPGSYNVRDKERLGKVHSRKNIMVSSQARFADPCAPKRDVPGPGYYGPHFVYGNLLKQTYNIVIAEQSADLL